MNAIALIRRMLLSILFALLLFANRTYAQNLQFDTFDGWSIVYTDAGSSNSCSAFITFPDQTVLQLAQVQTSSQTAWAIFLSNEKWNLILSGRAQLALSLLTDKYWKSTFSVTTTAAGDKPVLISLVPADFIRSIADAQALLVIDEKNEPLTGSFNMTDSARAIGTVERCVREHPLTSAPIPSPSG
jgi:hypothetical protein